MDFIPTLLWCFGGVMAGTLAVTLVGRWFRILAGALGIAEPGVPSPSSSERRTMWVLTLVNPVLWACLVGIPYGIYYFSRNPPGSGLRWFIGSAVVTFIGMYVLTFVTVYRARRRAAAQHDAHTDNVS